MVVIRWLRKVFRLGDPGKEGAEGAVSCAVDWDEICRLVLSGMKDLASTELETAYECFRKAIRLAPDADRLEVSMDNENEGLYVRMAVLYASICLDVLGKPKRELRGFLAEARRKSPSGYRDVRELMKGKNKRRFDPMEEDEEDWICDSELLGEGADGLTCVCRRKEPR